MRHDISRSDGRGELGAALAELGIVLPFMLALLLVVFDFGRGFLAYISVTDGARDGARIALAAAIQDGVTDCTDNVTTLSSGSTVFATIKEVAARSAAGSDFIDKDTVLVTPTYDAVTGECEVEVRWTYTPILPFVTASWSLPFLGTVGPLWDGSMSETAATVTE